MPKNKEFLKSFDQHIKSKFAYLPSKMHTMAVILRDGILLVDSNLDSDMFNIICCDGPVERKAIRESMRHFKIKKRPYAFWAGFEQDPAWLKEELLALGLKSDEKEWAMVCDLKKHASVLIHPDFDIRQVTEHDHVRDVIAV